jgi:hypothetical protein
MTILIMWPGETDWALCGWTGDAARLWIAALLLSARPLTSSTRGFLVDGPCRYVIQDFSLDVPDMTAEGHFFLFSDILLCMHAFGRAIPSVQVPIAWIEMAHVLVCWEYAVIGWRHRAVTENVVGGKATGRAGEYELRCALPLAEACTW